MKEEKFCNKKILSFFIGEIFLKRIFGIWGKTLKIFPTKIFPFFFVENCFHDIFLVKIILYEIFYEEHFLRIIFFVRICFFLWGIVIKETKSQFS